MRRNELRVDGERVFERARGRPELAESLVGVPPEHEQCRLRRRRQAFGREALEQRLELALIEQGLCHGHGDLRLVDAELKREGTFRGRSVASRELGSAEQHMRRQHHGILLKRTSQLDRRAGEIVVLEAAQRVLEVTRRFVAALGERIADERQRKCGCRRSKHRHPRGKVHRSFTNQVLPCGKCSVSTE